MNNYLLENTIWKVVLSNNEEVISDGQYIDGQSDWMRLKKYCNSNNLFIKDMQLSFRDHIIHIPKNKHYYFRRMSLNHFGKNTRNDGTYQYFIVGSTSNKSNVTITKYLIPELQGMEHEFRELDENEESLI